MRQMILDLLPTAPPSLDNFVVGRNGETLTGLAAWLAPDSGEPLFVLWGESGAGKSHLLQACPAAYYHDAREDSDLSEWTGNGAVRDAILAVDNLEALDASGQVALFNAINRLHAEGGRLLAAATVPPLRLALREDLRTRLGSGLIYRLRSLSDSEKIAALEAQATSRGLKLAPEVFTYLMERTPRDMRSLAALLLAIDNYSLEQRRPINLALLREVLRNAPPP